MAIRRAALIFDDRARPETTGVYCRRALERLVDIVHFRPDEFGQTPGDGFDLYLNIDDGFPYQLPAGLRPSAWWAVNTHLNFDWCRREARDFDAPLVCAEMRLGCRAEALRDLPARTTIISARLGAPVRRGRASA